MVSPALPSPQRKGRATPRLEPADQIMSRAAPVTTPAPAARTLAAVPSSSRGRRRPLMHPPGPPGCPQRWPLQRIPVLRGGTEMARGLGNVALRVKAIEPALVGS